LFIPLLKEDQGFNEYEILPFGYPQQLCFQKNDMRDVGAHLKSTLVEDFFGHDTTIFAAHSMGGLVVLHALLELDPALTSNKRLLVMSLGTPYYGTSIEAKVI
jgi:pimeloyl-ACP methyl ester carboxylesterase